MPQKNIQDCVRVAAGEPPRKTNRRDPGTGRHKPSSLPVPSGLAFKTGALKFIPFFPGNLLRHARSLPSQGKAETGYGRIAREIHIRMILVTRLVVVLCREVLCLFHPPSRIVALVFHALVHRERRYPDARQAEMVRAVIVTRFGSRIGADRQPEVLGSSLHDGKEVGALRAGHFRFLRRSQRRDIVEVQIE